MAICILCYCGGLQIGFTIVLYAKLIPKIKFQTVCVSLLQLYTFLVKISIDIFIIINCEKNSIQKLWISIFFIGITVLYNIYKIDTMNRVSNLNLNTSVNNVLS
jgi:hypothetical protein